MVMSQGTSTFLACFAGFWSLWALVVTLCCLCSVLQRRLKRRGEARPGERRVVDAQTPACRGAPDFALAPPAAAPHQQQMPRDPPAFAPPPAVPLELSHPLPEASWVSMPEADVPEKPPCYEEALLMEAPPPPYATALAQAPVGGGYPKATPPLLQDPSPESRKAPPPASSLIRLPWCQRRWDSLGRLLANVDLNPYEPESLPLGTVAMATMLRRPQAGLSGAIRGHGSRGLQRGCARPAALLGRSTAV